MLKNEIYSNTFIYSNNYFKRPHIDNLMRKNIQKPLTTVVALAGYGKTETVYSFLENYNCITIWQNMTVFDNSTDVYWKNTITNIAIHNKSIALKLENMGFYNSDKKFNVFLSIISNAMKPNKKYVFVYDDFHLIHNIKILKFLEKLVRARILNLSIIIISRSEPEINMMSLISKGLASNISDKDLCFTKAEISNYFSEQDFKISPSTLHNIYNITGGWLAAIQLIELSLKKGIINQDYAIESMKVNIFKIIEKEIFFDIPYELKKFLVKLSLFENFPFDILNTFSENDNSIIMQISKINLLVYFDSVLNSYCIQKLFLEFLIQKQSILTKYEKYECYNTAGNWYESKDYKIDAISCYEKTGDFENISKICLTFPYYLPTDISKFLMELFERIPKEVYENIPVLRVFRARILFSVLKIEKAEEELNFIIKEYEEKVTSTENNMILYESYILMGLFKNITNILSTKYDFKNNFVKAYKYMSTENVIQTDKNNIYYIGPYACRTSNHEKGYVEKYIENVKCVSFYTSKMICDYISGYDDLANAELLYFKNNIKEAEQFSYQALYKAKDQYAISNMTLFYLIRINLSAGNYLKIEEFIEQLYANINTSKYSYSCTLYDIITGWYYSTIEQSEKVANWIKNSFDKSNINYFLFGLESLAKIKYLLYQKEYYSILAFIEIQNDKYGIQDFLFGKIEMEAIKSVCLYHIKEREKAVNSLQKAYELALPNNLNMIFIELGNDMVSLGKIALKTENSKIPYDWLSNIIKKSSTYAKRRSHVINKYRKANNLENMESKLTKKELEFLTDVCQGLSRTEIAINHNVSLSFVKDKLQIICSKLGAKNTKDAICISYLMNLVR